MDFDRTIYTKSAKETAKLGEKLGNRVKKKVNGKRQNGGLESNAITLCLYGELGSGKTIFVQGFAKGLGITSRLLSPTFIIVRRYEVPRIGFWFYHIDLYRITHINELEALGIREIFQNPHNIVAIEWAEKTGGYLPQNRIDIKFSLLNDGSHSIGITELT